MELKLLVFSLMILQVEFLPSSCVGGWRRGDRLPDCLQAYQGGEEVQDINPGCEQGQSKSLGYRCNCMHAIL